MISTINFIMLLPYLNYVYLSWPNITCNYQYFTYNMTVFEF